MKQRIQIFGQRCSGTNFLEQLLLANFKNIEVVNYYAFKHIWNANLVREIKKDDGIKIIIIVRNPYDWLRSVHREPHHCPQLVGLPFDQFIRSPWIAYSKTAWNSVNPDIRLKNLEKAPVLEKFENAIVMRNVKNDLFNQIVNNFPEKVCLINYESLRSDLISTLKNLGEIHNLTRKNDEFIQISTYKNTEKEYTPKHLIRLSKETKKNVDKMLQFDIENTFGYKTTDYKYSSLFDFRLWRFRIKELLVKYNLYKENLPFTEEDIKSKDLQKLIQFKKKDYRNISNEKPGLKISILNEILEKDATDKWALLEKGILLKGKGETEEAINFFDRVLIQEPSHVRALFQKGISLKRLRKFHEAITILEKVNDLKPKWPPNLKLLQSLYVKLGIFDKAELISKELISMK